MTGKGLSVAWEAVKLAVPASCILVAVAMSFQAVRSAAAVNLERVGEDRLEIKTLRADAESLKDAFIRQNQDFQKMMAEQNEKTLRELGAIRSELAALRAGFEESRRATGLSSGGTPGAPARR